MNGIDYAVLALAKAKRPVIIVGAGVRLAGAESLIGELVRRLCVPVAPTWAALDMFPFDEPLLIGSFGTHGNRAANFAVQNADLILTIGSRLDTKATGTPENTFAPNAVKFMVDIDDAEIRKFESLGVEVYGVHMDAREAIVRLSLRAAYGCGPTQWIERIAQWKTQYPITDDGPYRVIRRLSEDAAEGDIICCDTGCVIAWTCQAWRFKKGQRLLHAWNQTPMGYGLPAAIGAHYATGKRVLLLTGDGSLMMNIGELATIRGLPIRIVLFNNHGHAMCRQTQREWLSDKYYATSLDGGLKFPDFVAVANAFGVELLEFKIDTEIDVTPKVKFGHPNHDAHPLLPRNELAREMEIRR